MWVYSSDTSPLLSIGVVIPFLDMVGRWVVGGGVIALPNIRHNSYNRAPAFIPLRELPLFYTSRMILSYAFRYSGFCRFSVRVAIKSPDALIGGYF